MTTFPRRATTEELRKPQKGTAKRARTATSRARVSAEDKHKAAAKLRDGKRCRRPRCPHCAQARNPEFTLHAAHVFEAKKMGGDPTLVRSQVRLLMTLDSRSHAEQESHQLEVVPLTDRYADGPCEFIRIEGKRRISEGISTP